MERTRIILSVSIILLAVNVIVQHQLYIGCDSQRESISNIAKIASAQRDEALRGWQESLAREKELRKIMDGNKK